MEAKKLIQIIEQLNTDIEALEKELNSKEKQLKQANEINDWQEIYSTYIYENFYTIDKEASEHADKETKNLNYEF